MRVIVVAGFLGSGKTSLILGLGRQLLGRGVRVAVIENEFSAQGIDGRVLERSGLAVRELAGGCVCCSLRWSLAQTLEALERELHPEVVLVEPSGIAGPAGVVEALAGSGVAAPPQVVGLIDATRLPRLLELNPFLVEGLLAAATLTVLSKADAVDSACRERCHAALAVMQGRGPVVPLSCRSRADAGLVLDELARRQEPLAPPVGGGPGVEAATASRQWTWTAAAPQGQEAWSRELAQELEDLAARLFPSGRASAGHLKAFADGGDCGWLAGSLTAREGVRFQGGITAPVRTLRIDLAAIIAGLTQDQVEAALDGAATRHGTGVGP